MKEYIDREAVVAIIEEKQKELCPVGRYGRGYVYGSDREKYDNWDEIIDSIENLTVADVVEVVHGKWETEIDPDLGGLKHTCPVCGLVKRTDIHVALDWNFCPHCGTKMDLEE